MLTVRRLLTRARTAVQALTSACLLAVALTGSAQAADTLYQTPVLLNQAGLSSGTTYWDVGAWSLCTAACGPSGTQTRTVVCIDNGNPVADSVCAAFEAKPALSQSCSDYRSCTYTWQTTNVGACSSTCGTGSQTRDVYCVRSYDNAIVSDASCTTAKPDSIVACSDTSSCTYRWMTGAWGACSTTCGTGTQTRSVLCQKEDGTTVSNAFCTASAPTSSQACTAYTGCTYAWVYSAWSSCSVGCGSGIQTRTASCQRADGTIVADSYCTAAKAALSQACTSYTTCTFSWVQAWGSCSTACGVGTQSTTNTCYRSDGTAVASTSCTTTAPATLTQSCSVSTGCSYAWVYSAWSGCSAGCGSGTQTRTASCQRSDGTIVADSYCTAAKAALSQACTNYAACTYTWISGSWGTCSTTCGTGTQTRTNTCQRSDGVLVANTSCTSTAPATSQSCTVNTGCTIDLSLSMTSSSTTALTGTPITLTLSITNTQTPTATGAVSVTATNAVMGGFTCVSATAGAACAANGAVTVPYGGSVVMTIPMTANAGATSASATGSVSNTTSGYSETILTNNSRTLSMSARSPMYSKWCYFPSARSVPSDVGSVYNWITAYVFDYKSTCGGQAFVGATKTMVSNACFFFKGTTVGVIPRFGVVYWSGSGSSGFGNCLNNGATMVSQCGYYGWTIMGLPGWAANASYYGGGPVTSSAVLTNPGWPAGVTGYTVWEENGPFTTCKAPGSAVWQNIVSAPQ